MPAVVVAAAVDAAADVQVDRAQVGDFVDVLVQLGQRGGDGDGAGVGQRAEVAAGAGDHVRQQADVGLHQTQRPGALVQGRQVLRVHPGQQQVLLVRQPRLAGAEGVGQLGQGVQRGSVGVARRPARALERQGDDRQLRQAVLTHVLRQPALEWLGGDAGFAGDTGGAQRGHLEAGLHALQLGAGDGVGGAVLLEDGAVLGLHRVDELLPLGLHQDLDARLVLVVAPAGQVVGADHGLDVVEQLVPGQELAHHAADDRRAAHAAAHLDGETHLAGVVAQRLQANVVPGGGGAVFGGAVEGDLELARQEGELGVQRAPLAQDLGERAGVDDLVRGDAGQRLAGDVADGVAAGLDAVHAHAGQQVHGVGGAGQRNPVELDVGAGGEVTVAVLQRRRDERQAGLRGLQCVLRALRLAQQRGLGLVEFARQTRQHAQLGAADLAVGHGNAQHRGVALHVPAVLQAQGQELLVAQFAALPALELVAELLGAQLDELAVEIGVSVHRVLLLDRWNSLAGHFRSGGNVPGAYAKTNQ